MLKRHRSQESLSNIHAGSLSYAAAITQAAAASVFANLLRVDDDLVPLRRAHSLHRLVNLG